MTDALWHRVTLCCPCPPHLRPDLATDIQADFRANYPHEHDVVCAYEDGLLILASTNDYDPEGLNLQDEFSDVITAFMPEPFDGEIEFVSSAPCEKPSSDNLRS